MACVLIVEDDEDVREFMDILLSSSGYQTATARNGAEALEAVRQTHPCLVLLDLMMPVMDGWTFRDRQLADPEFRRDLPGRGRADENRVLAIADVPTHAQRQPPIAVEPPQQRVRVEQEPHNASQASTSEGGSGSKKAAVTRALPRMAPNFRSGGTASIRTSLATGCLFRAMTISSPASARSMRRDRCVLAAWTVTTFITVP